jgi:protein-histidine pros-kinase
MAVPATPAEGPVADGSAALSTKGLLRLVLVASFLAALLAGAGGSYWLLHERAVQRVSAEAGRLLSVATAVRNYTSAHIVPIVSNEGTFHPVTVPAFAAQSVFKLVQGSYAGYSYREPSIKPTNPEDLPTPPEMELLLRFRASPDLKELAGVRRDGERSVYYLARPILAQDECLPCHGTPKQAPASMITKYGPVNGFGWKPGEVVAIQSLTVPAAEELRETGEIALVLAGGMLLVLTAIYFALTLTVDAVLMRPLRALAAAADAASTSDAAPLALPASGASEVRHLARAIERLRTSLRKALAQLG